MKNKKIKDRTIESSSQGEVLEYMEKNPVWLTTQKIADGMKLKNRVKIAKFLRKLHSSHYIDRQRVNNTNELEYRIKT